MKGRGGEAEKGHREAGREEVAWGRGRVFCGATRGGGRGAAVFRDLSWPHPYNAQRSLPW